MSEVDGKRPSSRGRRAPQSVKSIHPRWIDLEPFWFLEARVKEVLSGAGWAPARSSDDGDEFMKGRWRIMPWRASIGDHFNQIVMMRFRSDEACREFDQRHLDPEVATEIYMVYSFDGMLSLLWMADHEAAQGISDYLRRSHRG